MLTFVFQYITILTLKAKFRIGVPVILILQIILVIFIVYLVMIK